MEFWQAVILAVVEGVTEFLPVSSTGHLILASRVLGVGQTSFVKSFEIAIQSGAILAVAGLYWRRLVADMETMKRVAVAWVPTAILGYLLYPAVKNILLWDVGVTVGALVVGGVVMILWEKMTKKQMPRNKQITSTNDQITKLSYGRAMVIGVVQSVSMVPGVSRAMATILGGMGMGLSRAEATEFSFLLAVPTMAAATGYDLLKSGGSFTNGEWGVLLLGFVMAFLAALTTVKWLIGYVQKHDFTAFGVYRIAAAGLFVLVFGGGEEV